MLLELESFLALDSEKKASLVEVEISGLNKINADQWDQIGDVFEQCKALKKVSLRNNEIGANLEPGRFEAFCAALRKCPAEEIDLSNNDFCVRIEILITYGDDPQPGEMDMPRCTSDLVNSLKDEQWIMFGNAISGRLFKKFNFSDNGLGHLRSEPLKFSAVCNFFKQCNTSEMNLSKNQLQILTTAQRNELAVSLMNRERLERLIFSKYEINLLKERRYVNFYQTFKNANIARSDKWFATDPAERLPMMVEFELVGPGLIELKMADPIGEKLSNVAASLQENIAAGSGTSDSDKPGNEMLLSKNTVVASSPGKASSSPTNEASKATTVKPNNTFNKDE